MRRIIQTALLHNSLYFRRLHSLQQTVHQICYKRSETNDNISLLKATLKIRQTKFSLRREKQNTYKNTSRPPSSGMWHLLERYKRFEGTCCLYLQKATGSSETFVSHYKTTWRQIPVNKTTWRQTPVNKTTWQETPEEQDYLTPHPRGTILPDARSQWTRLPDARPQNKTTWRQTPEEQDYLTPDPRRIRLSDARPQKNKTT